MTASTRKRLIVSALAVLLAIGAGIATYLTLPPPAATPAEHDPQRIAVAEAFMQALERGDFAAAHARFDERSADALSVEQLGQVWTALPGQLGDLADRSPARSAMVGEQAVVIYRLAFARTPLDARISIDHALRVSGFRLVPATEPAPEAAASAGSVRERALTVAGDLPGILALPRGSGPFPAVLLVHGSGPNDRDETIGPNKPFRDLAHGLAERGIASLRYDKRTRVQPEAFSATATVEQEVIADALAALDLLARQDEIDADRRILLGHSLGALLAPRIAARADRLAGVVMLAAPARPLHRVIPQQIRYIAGIDGVIDPDEAEQIATLHAQSETIDALPRDTTDGDPMLGMSIPYLLDLRDYDPLATAAGLSMPMLILQGGRDYQVTEADDFAAWQSAGLDPERVEFRFHPDLNHLFMPGTGMATPAEYMLERKQVDVRVIDTIADWIEAR